MKRNMLRLLPYYLAKDRFPLFDEVHCPHGCSFTTLCLHKLCNVTTGNILRLPIAKYSI